MSDVRDIVTVILGIDGKERGDEYVFLCPSHNDRKPSAGVNLTSGLWHCLACGAGGDLVSLAMAVKGLDRGAAQRLVRPNTPSALASALHRHTFAALQYARGRRLEGKLDKLPGPYPFEPQTYLRSRGFTDETLRQYEAQYVEQETFRGKVRKYSIRDYVALPIRDAGGWLMGYVYRATNSNQKLRYLYTPGIKLTEIWYGCHLYEKEEEDIVVTEGALDSMWVAQAGFPALAMLGASMVGHKALQLRRYRTVTLFLDRDPAGVHAARTIGDALVGRVNTKVARYPKGVDAKDPADLTPEQIHRAVERAVPYKVWVGMRGGR